MLVYVDDILIVARSRADVDWVKQQLTSKFEAHDLGEANYFLGIDIVRDRSARTVKLSRLARRGLQLSWWTPMG